MFEVAVEQRSDCPCLNLSLDFRLLSEPMRGE